MKKTEQLEFRIHIPNLLKEITDNGFGAMPNGGLLFIPMNQFRIWLLQVSQRALELNDPKLNLLMCRGAMYAESDPADKENYDPSIIGKLEKQVRAITSEKQTI